MSRRKRMLEDLDQDIRDHIERETQDNIERGMSPDEARFAALRKFGNLTRVKEETREVWTVVWLEELWQDIRFGLRMLRKSPGFTAVAVLTLALGIGANTAIFSLVNGLMLRTLTVRDPGQLVELLHQYPGEPAFNGFSWDAYQIMRDGNHVFSALLVDTPYTFVVRGQKLQPQAVFGGFVDGTYFETLGLRPVIGRQIDPEDVHIGHPTPVAVVSWSFWKSRFDLDPAVLGKEIIVNNTPLTVIGVAPRGFFGLREELRQDVWLPLSMEPLMHYSFPGWGSMQLLGRLRPGVSIARAQAEMAVLFQTAIQAPGVSPFIQKMNLKVVPAGDGLSTPLRQKFSTTLIVLMAMVGVLLLIACTNLATLLLARGAARQHEMAARVCLGAGRLRLLRQTLTESLLLSVAGAFSGTALAYLNARALVRVLASGRVMPGNVSYLQLHFELDVRLVLFIGGVTLLTTILFGLTPGMRAAKVAPYAAFSQTSRLGESKPRRLFAKSLVVAQIALSVVLLSASVLFGSYLSNLENLNLGFRKDHLLLVTLDPSHSGYAEAEFSRLCQELLKQLQAIPGVRSDTLSEMTPMAGNGASAFANAEGRRENHRVVSINRISPNYFETYGTPLLAGRDFSARDLGSPPVAIINYAMARDLFGTESPIGRVVILSHITLQKGEKTYEIVGVAGDAKYNDIQQQPPRTIYLDVFQEGYIPSQLTIRTNINPQSVAGTVRGTVNSVLKTVPIVRFTTMTDQIDSSIVPQRLIAMLSVCFGALGALLAGIGLYGLLAYTVARRTHEIGVRMALGATPGRVMRMVLRDALWMVFVGLFVGAPLAFWAKSVAASLIRDLPAGSFTIIALGATAILATALIAAYLPARHAAKVDPMVALRYE